MKQHNKAIVINAEQVVAGSMNWSDSSDANNYVIFIQSPKVALEFIDQFQRLQSQSQRINATNN